MNAGSQLVEGKRLRRSCVCKDKLENLNRTTVEGECSRSKGQLLCLRLVPALWDSHPLSISVLELIFHN